MDSQAIVLCETEKKPGLIPCGQQSEVSGLVKSVREDVLDDDSLPVWQ
jgi:hypothetical protein